MIFGDDPISRDDRYVPNAGAIAQAANLYAFATNNPVIFNDPSGLARLVSMGGGRYVYIADCRTTSIVSSFVSAIPLVGLSIPAAQGLFDLTIGRNDIKLNSRRSVNRILGDASTVASVVGLAEFGVEALGTTGMFSSSIAWIANKIGWAGTALGLINGFVSLRSSSYDVQLAVQLQGMVNGTNVQATIITAKFAEAMMQEMFDNNYVSINRGEGQTLIWHNAEAEIAYRNAVVEIRTEAHRVFR